MKSKMVILYSWELLLTYRDNGDLSVLRAADRNINNLFVGFVKQVTGRSSYVSMVLFRMSCDSE